jgi:hypothetical protein
MGWNHDVLQDAVTNCDDPHGSGRIEDCPTFSTKTELQTETECTTCKMEVPEVIANEDCAGPMDALCGDVKITREEDDSSPVPDNDNANAPAAPKEPVKSTSTEAPPPATSSASSEVPSVPEETPSAPSPQPTDVVAGPIDNDTPAQPPANPEGQIVNAAPNPTGGPVVPFVSVAAAPPAPTQPPVQPPQEAPVNGPTTIYRTLSDRIEEVVYVEQVETVFVTATVPAPQKYRRHAHSHHMKMHRRDREHGLLGRKY